MCALRTTYFVLLALRITLSSLSLINKLENKTFNTLLHRVHHFSGMPPFTTIRIPPATTPRYAINHIALSAPRTICTSQHPSKYRKLNRGIHSPPPPYTPCPFSICECEVKSIICNRWTHLLSGIDLCCSSVC